MKKGRTGGRRHGLHAPSHERPELRDLFTEFGTYRMFYVTNLDRDY